MRLPYEKLVLLLCTCVAITTASSLQGRINGSGFPISSKRPSKPEISSFISKDVCMDKILHSMAAEVCTIIAEYCHFMGVGITEFMDEDEVTEFQCSTYCTVALLTETFATCEECSDSKPNEYNADNCPVSANLKIVEDTLVIGEDLFRALHTLPYGLFVSKSTIEDAGQGVFTQMDLPKNLRFGPYEGSIHDKDFDDDEGVLYSWTIHGQDEEQDGHTLVNALNVSYSNWMRYVNTPNCQKHENVVAVEFQQQIYYITLKPVKAGSELLVWYGDNYAKYLGLNEFNCD